MYVNSLLQKGISVIIMVSYVNHNEVWEWVFNYDVLRDTLQLIVALSIRYFIVTLQRELPIKSWKPGYVILLKRCTITAFVQIKHILM